MLSSSPPGARPPSTSVDRPMRTEWTAAVSAPIPPPAIATSKLSGTSPSRITSYQGSEHRVVVRRRLGDGLDHVPVLDDLAPAVQAEDVGHRRAAVLRRGRDVAVGDDEVALADHALDVDVQLRELRREALDEVDEGLEAVGRLRVVLDVDGPAVLGDRLLWLLVVERGRVVGDHG